MGRTEALTWQARAWGQLLGSAISYPFRSREHRLLLMRGNRLWRERILPTVDLNELARIPDSEAVHLEAVEARAHNCTVLELATLGAVTRAIRPRRVIEIGTFDGRGTLALALNAPEAEVFTLNLPPGYEATKGDTAAGDIALYDNNLSGERFQGHPAAERITQLWGDSRTFDFSPYAPAQVIFIDGAHDEQTCMTDSRTALEVIDRKNGAILWHDATLYGVRKVLPKLVGEGFPIRRINGTDIAVLRWSGGQPV